MPPAPPVSPRTRARNERNAEYSRRWRARRREARMIPQQPPPRSTSTQQRRSVDGLNDSSSRSAMTAAQEAAIIEAITSGY
ncbi:Protein 4.1 [Anopheles sinensis]|uniref:Protein 4.1 n=1 Tax=Anopheles sinensis TaxID=74873 RepID=A0A084W0N9_ANOSI|nr:Protein 4.1 [Anopheles sinensis]